MAIRLTVVKKARRLTAFGWLLTVSIFTVLFVVWMFVVHDFLAVNKPENTHIWVIEGYVSDSVLDSVAVMTGFADSLLFICAGLPVDKNFLCPEYNDYATYNADVLKAKGMDSTRVFAAPAEHVYSDRTYSTALNVKEKLKSLGYTSGKFNIVCTGTHARRSQHLYRKAFKSDWKVGVVSFPDHFYRGVWWRSSEGARAVVYEMFAYLYCVIFFHP